MEGGEFLYIRDMNKSTHLIMKKLVISIAAVLLSVFSISAQPHKVYCELLGTQKLMSTKCIVQVDFGQGKTTWGRSVLVDENGKSLVFNSMIDAMNHMGRFGWELEQAYVVTTNGQNVYHWLLSKYIEDGGSISEGFRTKLKYKNEVMDNDCSDMK